MRTYNATQRTEAVGLAMTLGCPTAAERTGIPRRTISHWLQHSGRVMKIEPATTEEIAAKLWEAVVTGTDAVLAGLRDPKARLSDKAHALRVVAEQHALLTGRSTANNMNINVSPEVQAIRDLTDEERETLRQMIDTAIGADALAQVAADPLGVDRQTISAALMAVERALAAREAGNE